MFANLRRDVGRLAAARGCSAFRAGVEAMLFDNGFQAVLCYRLARWFRVHGVPVLGPAISRLGLFLTGVELSPAAEIGPGLRITHGVGTVVGGYARIGADAQLLHQVTLGSPAEARLDAMPVVGDRCFLAAGAKLIGAIRVGDDVFVGANALVTVDIPNGSKVLSKAGIEVRPPLQD